MKTLIEISIKNCYLFKFSFGFAIRIVVLVKNICRMVFPMKLSSKSKSSYHFLKSRILINFIISNWRGILRLLSQDINSFARLGSFYVSWAWTTNLLRHQRTFIFLVFPPLFRLRSYIILLNCFYRFFWQFLPTQTLHRPIENSPQILNFFLMTSISAFGSFHQFLVNLMMTHSRLSPSSLKPFRKLFLQIDTLLSYNFNWLIMTAKKEVLLLLIIRLIKIAKLLHFFRTIVQAIPLQIARIAILFSQ